MDIEDLKCCGNCNESFYNGDKGWCCVKNTFMSPLIDSRTTPFHKCDNWEWDGYEKAQRIDERKEDIEQQLLMQED